MQEPNPSVNIYLELNGNLGEVLSVLATAAFLQTRLSTTYFADEAHVSLYQTLFERLLLNPVKRNRVNCGSLVNICPKAVFSESPDLPRRNEETYVLGSSWLDHRQHDYALASIKRYFHDELDRRAERRVQLEGLAKTLSDKILTILWLDLNEPADGSQISNFKAFNNLINDNNNFLNRDRLCLATNDPEIINIVKLDHPQIYMVSPEALKDTLDLMLFGLYFKSHFINGSILHYWIGRLCEPDGDIIVNSRFLHQKHSITDAEKLNFSQPSFPPNWRLVTQIIAHPEEIDYSVLPGGKIKDGIRRVLVSGRYPLVAERPLADGRCDGPLGYEALRSILRLKNYGGANGLDFVSESQVQSPEDVDVIVLLDRPKITSPLLNELMASTKPKILLIHESKLIAPENWDQDYHKSFNYVYTWDDTYASKPFYRKFNFSTEPYLRVDPELLNERFYQKKLICMIASAKHTKGDFEQYSLRLSALNWFETAPNTDFDLWGRGWDKTGLFGRLYKGELDNKLSTLTNYKFCLCIENATGYKGYITEKFLDCLVAGVVPIYAGPPNIADLVPFACYVPLNKFKSWGEMYHNISCITRSDYQSYIEQASEFLKSRYFWPFSVDHLICRLTTDIVNLLIQDSSREDYEVVIPFHDQNEFLLEALSSLQNQGLTKMKVTVIDNCSPVSPVKIIEKFKGGLNISYVQQSRNWGPNINWRCASWMITARYFSVLSGDDFFLPNHVRHGLSLLDANRDAALFFTRIMTVDDRSVPLGVLEHIGQPKGPEKMTSQLFPRTVGLGCFVTPSAAIIRTESFVAVGGFDPSFPSAGDWNLWICLARAGWSFIFDPVPRVCYRVHKSQDTNRALISGDMMRDHVEIFSRYLLEISSSLSSPLLQSICNRLKRISEAIGSIDPVSAKTALSLLDQIFTKHPDLNAKQIVS